MEMSPLINDTVYTLRNREPGLLPFNSIHHRDYRADSQVLSFFYITAAFFSHTLFPWPPIRLPPTREKHYRCTILFGVKTGSSNHSAVIGLSVRCFVCFCISVGFWYFFVDRAANRIYIHHHSLQAPGFFFSFPDNRKDLTFTRGGITTVYCIKMYSGFIDIHSIG